MSAATRPSSVLAALGACARVAVRERLLPSQPQLLRRDDAQLLSAGVSRDRGLPPRWRANGTPVPAWSADWVTAARRSEFRSHAIAAVAAYAERALPWRPNGGSALARIQLAPAPFFREAGCVGRLFSCRRRVLKGRHTECGRAAVNRARLALQDSGWVGYQSSDSGRSTPMPAVLPVGERDPGKQVGVDLGMKPTALATVRPFGAREDIPNVITANRTGASHGEYRRGRARCRRRRCRCSAGSAARTSPTSGPDRRARVRSPPDNEEQAVCGKADRCDGLGGAGDLGAQELADEDPDQRCHAVPDAEDRDILTDSLKVGFNPPSTSELGSCPSSG